MNRVFGMCCQFLGPCVLCLSLMACREQVPPEPAPPSPTADAHYLISGGVSNPGPRTLAPGDTLAIVIDRNLPPPTGQKAMTIVLIRHAPEGKTHQLIQLDARGHLMDEKQNFALRNGDELVFPGGKGSNPTGNPTAGPQRGPG